MWRSFNNFIIRLDRKPKLWEDRLVLFVGHLINCNKKSTTVNCYISAIKAVLAKDGVILNENRYLLNALTRACRLSDNTVRTRLPIQKGLLHLILKQVARMFDQQQYLKILYMSILTTGYYGLFRIGELTTGTHPIKAVDVHIARNKDKVLFVLRTSKTHNASMKPQTVKIETDGTAHLQFCPFRLIKNYLRVRRSCRHKSEPFYIFRDRSPVTPVHVRKVLREALDATGLQANLYDCRGLRAGRAIDLQRMQFSLESIKFFGRWRSNAVFTYLKHN